MQASTPASIYDVGVDAQHRQSIIYYKRLSVFSESLFWLLLCVINVKQIVVKAGVDCATTAHLSYINRKILLIKIFLFFLGAHAFLSVNAQVFLVQRVKYLENYNAEILNKHINVNYTELVNNDKNTTYILDSNANYLIDAVCELDSIKLFYQSPLNKVSYKKVLCPINFMPIEPFKVTYKYLKTDPLHWYTNSNYMIDSIIPKSELINDNDQELLSVYTFDDIEVAINQFNGFLRIYKNKVFFKDIMSLKGIPRFGMNFSNNKKHILDKKGNNVLFIVYSSRMFSKTKTYLLEFDITTGEIKFKSPFNNNVSAFYLNNGNIIIVSTGYNDNTNNVYLFNKKTNKMEYGFNNSHQINAILLGQIK